MGSKIGQSLLTWALNWLRDLLIKVAQFYTAKAEAERTNAVNREALEKAETEDERQRATDRLSGRLGRR
jgi:hypothetical protein